jgi:parvulin-like peptidyl-prolyl isomerase
VVATVGAVAITKTALNGWIADQAPRSSAADDQTRQQALRALISGTWLLGEAAKQGLSVSSEEVLQRYEGDRREAAPNGAAEFREFLEQAGETPSQLRARIRVELAAAKLRRLVASRQPAVTETQVADYYRAHRQRFVTPEERTIDIAKVPTVKPAEN